MEPLVYLPVEKILFKDLYDWAVPVQKCKTNKVMLSPSKSPRKTGITSLSHREHEPNTGTLIHSNEQDIALFRYKSKVYAVNEKCPHAGGPLHLGEIEDLGVELLCIKCPWHGWKIDPGTGKVMSPEGHNLQSAVVYPVKVTDEGRIFIGFHGLNERYFKIEKMDF